MAKMKLKTNRSAAKRIKTTGSGKFKRGQAGKRHLLTSKESSRTTRLSGWVAVADANVPTMKRLLPYGNK